MITDRALLFLYAETPIHAGADTGSGVVDLPIQRETTTELPIIKGESLKGALREHFRPPPGDNAAYERWIKIFGSEPPEGGGTTTPGSLRVHECQLVAFPAPASSGTFAWVSSPLIRARLERKAKLANVSLKDADSADDADESAAADQPSAPDDTLCVATHDRDEWLVLGPFVVATATDPGLRRWSCGLASRAFPDGDGHSYFSAKFTDDLLYGSDDLLTALTRVCAPLTARVQLGKKDEQGEPTKTVSKGPFVSEYLPAETLLAALLEAPPGSGVLDKIGELNNKILVVGGDENIGKGLMWCRLIRGDK